MTIKEFANKYGIPYHVAYNATYHVKPISNLVRDRDYLEEDLFTATSKDIEARINRLQGKLSQANRDFINLHSTRAKEGYPCELPKVRREIQNV